MGKVSTITDSTDPVAAMPSPGVRTLITFAIFVHLFAVGTALVGRNPGFSSPLATKLADVFAPYRRFLDMDLSYAYPLTRADVLDVDHVLEIDLKLPDGSVQTVRLPDNDVRPRSRYHRYQMLAYNVAAAAGNEGLEGHLPRGLGLALVDLHGATEATVKCRGHLLQDWQRVVAGDDPNRAELWRQVYAARVWRSKGQPKLMKLEERAETAPSALPGSNAADALGLPKQ